MEGSQRKLHVACIMDGNGRWAGQHGLPRTAGHTEGEENLARVVRLAVARDVGWLTVFGFSTENWIRPRAEVRRILARSVALVWSDRGLGAWTRRLAADAGGP